MMHSANSDKSTRLQRMLHVLKGFPNGATTFELQALTNSMAPATDVSELRANGHVITCRYAGKTSTGRKFYSYRYMGKDT